MSSNDFQKIEQITGLSKIEQSKAVKVIAITGGKGGVGKTNLSVNLATQLAMYEQNVILLDADYGLANVNILLGLRANQNLSHVLSGEASLEQIMLNGPQGIEIIPAASGLQKMTDLSCHEHYGLIQAFSELTQPIDYLLIDTPAGISDSVLTVTKACQEIMLVVCNEPTSIADAYALMKVLSTEHQIQRFHVVANMVRNLDEAQKLFSKLASTASRFLDVTLVFDGMIPFDELLRLAVQKQQALVECYPTSRAALSFQQLTKRIMRWPKNNKNSGHIGFFIERLINNETLLQESFA